MTHPVRGAAAIVGVADEISPSGTIDGDLRSIESRVVRAALDDAGLSLADVATPDEREIVLRPVGPRWTARRRVLAEAIAPWAVKDGDDQGEEVAPC